MWGLSWVVWGCPLDDCRIQGVSYLVFFLVLLLSFRLSMSPVRVVLRVLFAAVHMTAMSAMFGACGSSALSVSSMLNMPPL